MAEQQLVELPDSLMASIKAIATCDDLPPYHRLQGVLMLINGWAWFSEQQAVDPQSVALPRKQWLEVCELLTNGVLLDAIAGVNLGLSFMNKGPSSR